MERLVGGSVRLRRVSAVVAACLLLGACSGSKATDAVSEKGRDGDAAASSSTTSVDAAKAGSSKASPRKSTTTTTKPSGPSAAEGSEKSTAAADDSETRILDVTMTLTEKCVRPGGSQTITIHAPYGTAAGYDTYYSDGKSGLHEGFHGGNMVGWTDDTDTWTHTWVVGPTAPPGRAVVVVMAVHDTYGRGETGDIFAVADPLGLCAPISYDEE